MSGWESFETAVGLALDDPDLKGALAELEGDGDAVGALRTALGALEAEIEADAAGELEALRLARERYETELRRVIDLELANSPQSPLADQLRSGIADLQVEIDRLLEQDRHERAALQGLRIDQELRKVKGRSLTDAAARREHEKSVEDAEYEYQRQVEKLQILSKSIADLVTDRKRLALQIERIEDRIVRELRANPPKGSELETSVVRLDAAAQQARRALVERAILPRCRTWVNEHHEQQRHQRYRNTLDTATATGLSELPNSRHFVATPTHRRLEQLLRRLPGGSIGIAGPRGSGKTTLIRTFCQDSGVPAVMVAAPIRFAPLEFVFHLLEQACRSVLPRNVTLEPTRASSQESDARPTRAHVAHIASLVIAAAATVVGCFLLIRGLNASHIGRAARFGLLAAGVVVAAGITTAVSSPMQIRAADRAGVTMGAGIAGAAILATAVRGTWPIGAWAAVVGTGIAGMGLYILSERWLVWRQHWRWIILCGGITTTLAAAAAATVHRVSSSFTAGVGLLLVAILALPIMSYALRAVSQLRARPEARVNAPTPSAAPLWEGLGIAATQLEASLILFGVGLMVLGWVRHDPTASVVVGLFLMVCGSGVARTLVLRPRYGERPAFSTAIERAQHAGHHSEVVPLFEEEDHEPARSIEGKVQPLHETKGPVPELQALAQDQLRQIKWQRGYTSEWSGKMGVTGPAMFPVTAESTRTRGQTSSERPVTLPDAVGLLRTYLSDAAAIAGGFLIGIDELDKIASADDAEAFLNEIKALFGIPGCYFLISISEDAVANFERRGMPLRDVFDSSFDDVLRVGYFDLSGTEALLKGRTLGMPLPHIAVCHCLAGGLPRDAIRVGRRLFEIRDATRVGSIGALSRLLATSELTSKRDGTATAVSRLGEHAEAPEVVNWLGDISRVQANTESLTERWPLGHPTGADAKAVQAIRRLAQELAAFWYLCATVGDFFSDDRGITDIEAGERATGAEAIEQLAHARQGLTVDPALAWHRISAFRAAWGLEQIHAAHQWE